VDFSKVLRDLRQERDQVQEAILRLERLAVGRALRRAPFDMAGRKRIQTALSAEAAEIEALLGRLLIIEEEERRRISRELHDSLVQLLASAAIDAGQLAAAIPSAGSTRTRALALQARIAKASDEARHIAHQLHPSVLDDLGLMISLRSFCDEFAVREDIFMEFDGGQLSLTVPLKVASSLYRIAQESLQNIAKYAHAKRVRVKLVPWEKGLRLSIEDDGVGFDLAAVHHKGRLGLVSMEERARLIGATLSIQSKPGRGTRIAVRVPVLEARGEVVENVGES
jgi:signal transduction histidine kinase